MKKLFMCASAAASNLRRRQKPVPRNGLEGGGGAVRVSPCAAEKLKVLILPQVSSPDGQERAKSCSAFVSGFADQFAVCFLCFVRLVLF